MTPQELSDLKGRGVISTSHEQIKGSRRCYHSHGDFRVDYIGDGSANNLYSSGSCSHILWRAWPCLVCEQNICWNGPPGQHNRCSSRPCWTKVPHKPPAARTDTGTCSTIPRHTQAGWQGPAGDNHGWHRSQFWSQTHHLCLKACIKQDLMAQAGKRPDLEIIFFWERAKKVKNIVLMTCDAHFPSLLKSQWNLEQDDGTWLWLSEQPRPAHNDKVSFLLLHLLPFLRRTGWHHQVLRRVFIAQLVLLKDRHSHAREKLRRLARVPVPGEAGGNIAAGGWDLLEVFSEDTSKPTRS